MLPKCHAGLVRVEEERNLYSVFLMRTISFIQMEVPVDSPLLIGELSCIYFPLSF